MGRLIACAECGKKRKVINEKNDNGMWRVTLSCGHTFTDLDKSEEATIISEPFYFSKSAFERGDYFAAITYACAILEGYGKQLLAKEFRTRRLSINDRTINSFSLHSVIVMLYVTRLIGKQEFLTLMTLKKHRNKFVHEGKAMAFSSKYIVKVEPVMEKSYKCIRKIMKKLGAYAID